MKKFVIIGVFVAGLLAACFSPWEGDEATLTINLGGGSNGRLAAWPPFNDDGIFSYDMTYIITLDGPNSITETKKFAEGDNSANAKFSFSLIPGTYKIEIKVYLQEGDENILYAYGSAVEEVKAGQNTAVSIQMIPQDNSGTEGLIFKRIEGKNEYEVTGIKNPVTEIVVPPKYNGLPVTEIANNAFKDCTDLISVEIPASVTTIGDSAFRGCKDLESITFAGTSGLLTIEDNAFYECTGLKSITIPASVTTIGERAFNDCEDLGVVNFSGDNQSQLRTIGQEAFANCSDLTDITIPSTVTTIGFGAFANCDGLESITLPFVGGTFAGTTSAGTQYFAPNGSNHFGYIFYAADYDNQDPYLPNGLTTVTITGGEGIPSYAFYSCTNLISITIPDTVTTISHKAFAYSRSITSIDIPAGVTSMSTEVFDGWGVDGDGNPIPQTINILGHPDLTSTWGVWDSGCFATINYLYYTPGLYFEPIENGDHNTVAYRVRQAEGANLTGAVYIPDMYRKSSDDEYLPVTEIGKENDSQGGGAFEGCYDITDITIPASVKIIGSWAFYYLPILETVVFKGDSDLEEINHSAFKYCSLLNTITIPEKVWYIGPDVFFECTDLMEITIPESVTNISQRAFGGWQPSQTIRVRGYQNEASANSAWNYSASVDWLSGCNATRKYWDGSGGYQ